MIRVSTSCLTLLFVFIVSFCFKASATTLPDFPFVTVSGTSTQQVKPDIAEVNFKLTTFNSESKKASDQLANTTKKVLEILSANNIKDSDIVALEINKFVRRSNNRGLNQANQNGYEFSRDFTITIHDISYYSNILTKLQELDNLVNIRSTFDTTKREDIQIALITSATEKAKQKADVMAAGLGVRLDGVFAFNDTGSFSRFFATFGLSDNVGARPMALSETRMRSVPNSVFVPQHIEISKTINVIYKIRR